MAQDFGERVMNKLMRILARDGVNNGAKMNQALNLLARYRAREVWCCALYRRRRAGALRAVPGHGVHNRTSEGNIAPKLLGCYEQELHDVIERCVEAPYETIVNIGCGDGFYAVGFARRMPQVEIKAYDLNADRQEFCRAMAQKNDVGDRIFIGGQCGAAELNALQGHRVLVVCDIEGGERELLDPERISARREFDILVELHEELDAALPEEVLTRFSESDDIERIAHQGRDPYVFKELSKARQLDQSLAIWHALGLLACQMPPGIKLPGPEYRIR